MSDSLSSYGLEPIRFLFLSMRFSRQEYCSGLPCPPPGDLPNPGIKPRSPTLQFDSLSSEPPGKPRNTEVGSLSFLQVIFPTQESNPALLHWTGVSCIAGGFFTYWAVREAPYELKLVLILILPCSINQAAVFPVPLFPWFMPLCFCPHVRINESFYCRLNIEPFLYSLNPPCHGAGTCSFVVRQYISH